MLLVNAPVLEKGYVVYIFTATLELGAEFDWIDMEDVYPSAPVNLAL